MGQTTKIITGEEPFQVPSGRFAIGASGSGYTLKWALRRDAEEWATIKDTSDTDATVAADTPQLFTGGVPGVWYKCHGETGSIELMY